MITAQTELSPSRSRSLEALVTLIAEFFDLDPSAVRARLRHEYEHPGSYVASAWRAASPRTTEEITRFYQETDAYVYDLAADHCRPRRDDVWRLIERRLWRRPENASVLTYGDGIGSDSIKLARAGHKVTYFDLPGVTARFATFRFEREGLLPEIRIVAESSTLEEASFDVILSIEVLEHLPDPIDAMRLWHLLLRRRGIVIATESFESVGSEYPSHLESNYQFAGRTHQMMEAVGFASTYFNMEPPNYPMEFTKIGPGLSGLRLQLGGRVRRAAKTRWNYVRVGVRRRLSSRQP